MTLETPTINTTAVDSDVAKANTVVPRGSFWKEAGLAVIFQSRDTLCLARGRAGSYAALITSVAPGAGVAAGPDSERGWLLSQR